MKIEGTCPHCGRGFRANVAKSADSEDHSCGHCGYPIHFFAQGDGWGCKRGEWGVGGHETAFHGLVCTLFNAVCGKVNYGPDCYSGAYNNVHYDRLEAKCYSKPVDASVVSDAIDKYLERGVQMAIISGQLGFTDGAVEAAKTYGVHLYRVRLGPAGYYPSRVC